MEINHFGVNIASSGNLAKGNKPQAQKAARVAGSLNDLMRINKYMRMETKIKNIYKANVRPIVTCTTNKSGNIKIQKNFGGKLYESTKKPSLQNKNIIRSQVIRESCRIDPINEYNKEEEEENCTIM